MKSFKPRSLTKWKKRLDGKRFKPIDIMVLREMDLKVNLILSVYGF